MPKREDNLEVTQLENEFLTAFNDALIYKGAASVTMAELVFLAERAEELSNPSWSNWQARGALAVELQTVLTKQFNTKRAHVVATLPIVFGVLGGNRAIHQQKEERKDYKALLPKNPETALQKAIEIPMAILKYEKITQPKTRPVVRTLAQALQKAGAVPLLTAAQKSDDRKVRESATKLLAFIRS